MAVWLGTLLIDFQGLRLMEVHFHTCFHDQWGRGKRTWEFALWLLKLLLEMTYITSSHITFGPSKSHGHSCLHKRWRSTTLADALRERSAIFGEQQ